MEPRRPREDDIDPSLPTLQLDGWDRLCPHARGRLERSAGVGLRPGRPRCLMPGEVLPWPGPGEGPWPLVDGRMSPDGRFGLWWEDPPGERRGMICLVVPCTEPGCSRRVVEVCGLLTGGEFASLEEATPDRLDDYLARVAGGPSASFPASVAVDFSRTTPRCRPVWGDPVGLRQLLFAMGPELMDWITAPWRAGAPGVPRVRPARRPRGGGGEA